jgi:hypothetical protein
MAYDGKADQARARYWRNVVIQHFREHPVGSMADATTAVVNEFSRLLDAEVEAEKRSKR